MTYGDILRDYKSELNRGTPHSKAKIRLVQYCAAIAATNEVLFLFWS